MGYLTFIITDSLSLIVISLQLFSSVKNVFACERETAELSCENGKIIHFIDGNYGRTSLSPCADGPKLNTTCYTENAIDIISTHCQQRQHCTIESMNKLFGYPCPGTYKYLNILFECVTLTDTQREQPKYHKDEDYNIRKSNYFECNDGKDIRSSYVCNGIEDCSDGEGEFDCDYDTIYAEENTMSIECNKDEVIKIINGNYGRKFTKICQRDHESQRVDCEAVNSAAIIEDKCAGRESCNIRSTDTVFGDSCPDTYKYLEVHYQCMKDARRLRRIIFG